MVINIKAKESIAPCLLILGLSLESSLVSLRYCYGIACCFPSFVGFGPNLVFYPLVGRGSHKNFR